MPEDRIEKEDREKEVTDPLDALLKGLEEEPIREEVKSMMEEVAEQKEEVAVVKEEVKERKISKKWVLLPMILVAAAFSAFFLAMHMKAQRCMRACTKLAEAGDIKKAEEFYKEAVKLGFKKVKATCMLASSYIKAREYDEALRVLHAIRKEHPEEEELQTLLTRLYRIRKEKVLLHSLCEKILRERPLCATAIAGLGWIKLWEGELERAKEMATAALGEEPKNIEALSLLQGVYIKMGMYGEAVSVHRCIYKLTKGKYCNADALVKLCDAFLKKRKVEIAEELIERAKRQDPSNPQVYYQLARIQSLKRAREEALHSLKICKGLDPSFAPAHTLYAHLLLEKGQVQKAIESLQVAIKLAPSLPYPYKELAHIYYYKLDDMKEALSFYKKAVSLGMDDELLHYNLGVAHYKMGQMPDAIKSWEKILPKIGEEPNLCFNLANAYALSGRLRRALHFYQRAIDGYKSMVHKAMRTENEEKEKYAYSLLAKAYNNLATVFEKEKHWQKASNLYAKALQCSSIAGELSPLSYKNINRLCLKAKGKPHFYKDVMKKMRG